MDPVIVIGAGPVGQTTALLLARWGVPVILIDSRARREPVGSKAICQQRDVLDIWQSVGLGTQIATEGVTWSQARIFWREQEIASWQFLDRGISPFPPFVNISQARTEQILDEAIFASTLIDFRRGWLATSLDQDDTGVRVRCVVGDREEVLRGSYAVACCGSRGALREQLGIDFPGESYDDRFLICDIRADLGDWVHERRFYFDPPWNPGRQVLIHACPDSVYRIDWQVPRDYDPDDDVRSGGLARRIQQIVGEAPYEILWRSVYRFDARVANQLRVGRVLLAGDMAHVVAPFGARGLNSGVMDAENAAWKIAFVLHGWSGGELLNTYHVERHAAALENLAVTGETMRFLVPRNDAEHDLRSAALAAAAADPTQHSRVNSGRFAEPFWYIDSPLTTPDPSRPFCGRPDIGRTPPPGPGVLVPDLPVEGGGLWLRRLARDGVLVLLAEAVDAGEMRATLAGVTLAPLRVESMSDLDPSGHLADVLGARPGEAWVIRPDAYISAVLPASDDQLREACRQATGGITR